MEDGLVAFVGEREKPDANAVVTMSPTRKWFSFFGLIPVPRTLGWHFLRRVDGGAFGRGDGRSLPALGPENLELVLRFLWASTPMNQGMNAVVRHAAPDRAGFTGEGVFLPNYLPPLLDRLFS